MAQVGFQILFGFGSVVIDVQPDVDIVPPGGNGDTVENGPVARHEDVRQQLPCFTVIVKCVQKPRHILLRNVVGSVTVVDIAVDGINTLPEQFFPAADPQHVFRPCQKSLARLPRLRIHRNPVGAAEGAAVRQLVGQTHEYRRIVRICRNQIPVVGAFQNAEGTQIPGTPILPALNLYFMNSAQLCNILPGFGGKAGSGIVGGADGNGDDPFFLRYLPDDPGHVQSQKHQGHQNGGAEADGCRYGF